MHYVDNNPAFLWFCGENTSNRVVFGLFDISNTGVLSDAKMFWIDFYSYQCLGVFGRGDGAETYGFFLYQGPTTLVLVEI